MLYDQGKFADAKAAYQAVKDSKLATVDLAVKGRALEGIGISLEGTGDKDGALKAFGELSNIDGLGFNALGAYHQARLAYAAGNLDKAKEYLKDAQKRLDTLAGGTDAKGPQEGARRRQYRLSATIECAICSAGSIRPPSARARIRSRPSKSKSSASKWARVMAQAKASRPRS